MQIQSRVRLPWKPADLRYSFIVLRRRVGRSEEYVEDLRFPKIFVRALLRCLSQRGAWREYRGEDPMRAYYTDFDCLTSQEIDEVLPDDGVPETLCVHDVEDQDEAVSISSTTFQEWIWEARRDCTLAQRPMQLWILTLRGSPQDTLADLYDSLLLEHKEAEAETACEVASGKLPLTFLARLLVKYGYVPFDVVALSEAEIRTQLVTDMLMETHSVQALCGFVEGFDDCP